MGKSQWTLWKKVKYFIDGLISTSYLPIRFMSLVGTLTALAGFVYALVVVYVRLTNTQPFTGYAPLMIVLLIVGGLIMTMLGVIGEYVWRIYDETRARPSYIVRDRFAVPTPGGNGVPTALDTADVSRFSTDKTGYDGDAQGSSSTLSLAAASAGVRGRRLTFLRAPVVSRWRTRAAGSARLDPRADVTPS